MKFIQGNNHHAVPIALAGEERDAIMQLQEKGIIRPSTSPWASPLVEEWESKGMCRLQVIK